MDEGTADNGALPGSITGGTIDGAGDKVFLASTGITGGEIDMAWFSALDKARAILSGSLAFFILLSLFPADRLEGVKDRIGCRDPRGVRSGPVLGVRLLPPPHALGVRLLSGHNICVKLPAGAVPCGRIPCNCDGAP